MEGSLGVRGFVAQEDGSYVLILVLMEDTLGEVNTDGNPQLEVMS